MPKLDMDPPYQHLRGKIGGLVYSKQGERGTVVSKARTSNPPMSAAQQAATEKFTAAAAYASLALADPALAARYATAAAAVGLHPRAFAMKDYYTPPEVTAIDAAGYHGAIGDPIKVKATDGFEVAGVKVILRSAANAVLEQGAAVLTNGVWHYTATGVVAEGTEIAVEAVATDRPGHTGTRTLTLTVA